MSIRRWLQATENNPLLPKIAGDSGILAANKLVATVTAKKDRKRGQYHQNFVRRSPNMRVKMEINLP